MKENHLQISPETAQQYRRFKAAALVAVRGYDGSEESSENVLARLIEIEEFIQEHSGNSGLTSNIETQFSQACRAQLAVPRTKGFDGHSTILSMLDKAIHRLEKRTNNILEWLRNNTKAVVHDVYGCLVLPDSDNRRSQPNKNGEPTSKMAEKTKQIVFRLIRMGIFTDDMRVYPGDLKKSMRRKLPYTMIEIPRLGKQIAVCDLIGEVTLVSNEILPISVWGGLRKTQLEALPGMRTVCYDRQEQWLRELEDILLDKGAIVPAKTVKVKIQREEKPSFTEQKIVEWMKLFYEHEEECSPDREGKYPSNGDHTVWERDSEGNWVEVKGENWHSTIEPALRDGGRALPGGSSIHKLKKKYGLTQKLLAKETIRDWCQLFYERAKQTRGRGKCPTVLDKIVWERDSEGIWVQVKGERWDKINGALRKGFRGLPGGSSLNELMEEYSITDNFTEEEIVKYFRLFYEKTKEDSDDRIGRYPNNGDPIVWDRDKDGNWIVVQDESFSGTIESALRNARRGMPGGSSIAKIKTKYGLVDDYVPHPRKRLRALRPVTPQPVLHMTG